MRRSLSLNKLLLIFSLLLAFPIVAALAYSSYVDWQNSEQAVRNANTQTAKIIAAQVDGYISDARFMLEQMAARPSVRNLDPGECDPALDDFLALHTQFTTVFTVGPDGQLVCSTTPPANRPSTAFGDRAWFQDLVANNEFVISEPQIGKLSGKWVAVLAVPVHGADNRTAGVIAFSLDLIRFQEPFATSVSLEDTVVRIINNDGTIVASSDAPEQWVGRNFADNTTVQSVLSSFSGQDQSTGLDGIERLQSYTTIGSANWHVWVGEPVETAFVAARDNSIRNGVIALLLLVAAGAFAFMAGQGIVGPVNRLAQAARAVGQGNRDVRAPVEGPAEIADMALAFNAMLAARNRVEEDLQQSEEVFKKAFQASPEALLIRRLSDNAVLDVNPAFEEVTGFSRKEVYDEPNVFFELLAGPDYLGVVPNMLASGQPVVNYEVQFRHKSGEMRDALITAENVEIRGERCLLVIGRDITEIRQAERARLAVEAAESANKAKSEFLSSMSHELRTPLNAVLGFTELLEMENPTQRQYENLEHIRNAGQHLLKLVNEVLDMARIEAQQINLAPEPVPVSDILKECVDLIAPSAQRDNIEIRVASNGPANDGSWNEAAGKGKGQSAEQWVLADRQKLRQTLLNLLSNAIKYNHEGGSVTVGSSHDGNGYIRISVADTGEGISPEQMKRLFVPFERLEAGRRNIEGTGLGLALSKLLVEAMAGRIGVESEQGSGSTFWVELPRVVLRAHDQDRPRDEIEGSSMDEVTHETTTGNVLYIEDNLSNLKLVEGILRHRPGVKLAAAVTGGEGLEAARQSKPDVILLDLNLPDMHGEEVFRQLRDGETTAQIPVVIVSADASPDQIRHLESLGAYSYVTKPVDIHRLLGLIDDLLGKQS